MKRSNRFSQSAASLFLVVLFCLSTTALADHKHPHQMPNKHHNDHEQNYYEEGNHKRGQHGQKHNHHKQHHHERRHKHHHDIAQIVLPIAVLANLIVNANGHHGNWH